MDQTTAFNDDELLQTVAQRSGTAVSACYQCHKCTTGCPVGPEMDLLPSQVMRMVHLGQADEVLTSQSIWLCASCEACTTRCPMAIDVAGVMDALRIMAIDRRIPLPDARGSRFHRCFLGSVHRHGRVYEIGMMAAYKCRTFDLFSDAGKIPRMLAQGRLSLLPNRGGDIEQVRDIGDRAQIHYIRQKDALGLGHAIRTQQVRAARPVLPRPPGPVVEKGGERRVHLVEIAHRVLVEDHDVGAQPLEAPVFLSLEDLAHERQVVLLDDPHQEDGKIARNAVRPEARLAQGAAGQDLRAGAERTVGKVVERVALEGGRSPPLESGGAEFVFEVVDVGDKKLYFDFIGHGDRLSQTRQAGPR